MVEAASREQRRQEQLCPALVQSQPALGAAYSFLPFCWALLAHCGKGRQVKYKNMSKIRHKVQQVYITQEQF